MFDMSQTTRSEVHPSIVRLEKHLNDVGLDRARFLELIDIYPQKYNNWRVRGIPEGKIADISKETGLSYYYLRDGKSPKYNAASGTLMRFEQKIGENEKPDYVLTDLSGDTPEVYKIYVKLKVAYQNKKLNVEDVTLLDNIIDRLMRH